MAAYDIRSGTSDPNWKSRPDQRMLDRLSSGAFSDMTILCGAGEELKAHRVALYGHSPYIDRCLDEAERCGQTTELDLRPINVKVVRRALEVFYSGDHCATEVEDILTTAVGFVAMNEKLDIPALGAVAERTWPECCLKDPDCARIAAQTIYCSDLPCSKKVDEFKASLVSDVVDDLEKMRESEEFTELLYRSPDFCRDVMIQLSARNKKLVAENKALKSTS